MFEYKLKKACFATALLWMLSAQFGCALIPRNLEEVKQEVNWITYISPVGLDARPPSGADLYMFRVAAINRKTMLGAGMELAQVMYFRDSETYISLLAPYVYYSPLGIVEPASYGSDGTITSIQTRMLTFLYAGGAFLSIPRTNDPTKPSKIHFDAGAGITFKRLDIRLGAAYKHSTSTGASAVMPYIGVNYNLLGPRWGLGW